MRKASAIVGLLGISAIAAVATAPAQAYPICLRVYGDPTYDECGYTTMAQCRATASGRSALCFPNAFAAYPVPQPGGRAYRRHGTY